jgi:hypothetical protein
MKQKLIIYDIDGVVANSQARYQRNGGDFPLVKHDYNEFRKCMVRYAEDVHDDPSLEVGVSMINQIRLGLDVDRMVAVTARGEEGREKTLSWLQSHMPWEVKNEDLIMRPAYVEYSPGVYWVESEEKFDAVEFKRMVAVELMENYDVVMAFDDHHDISHAYWEIGIPSVCLMVPGVDQGTRMQAAISNVVQG